MNCLKHSLQGGFQDLKQYGSHFTVLKVMLMGQQLSIVNLKLVSAGCWIHQRLFQNYFTKKYNQLIQQKKPQKLSFM